MPTANEYEAKKCLERAEQAEEPNVRAVMTELAREYTGRHANRAPRKRSQDGCPISPRRV